MKYLVFSLMAFLFYPFSGFGQYACAGLDRVDIYLNNKLIATSTFADAPVLKIDPLATDTILLHAYTNWDGLRNSTMNVNDESGELIEHVNSTNNTGYEAVFIYVFRQSDIDDPDLKSFYILLNLLCEKTVETEQIATFNLSGR